LSELLYADPSTTRVPEKAWLALVRAIAAGDEAALRELFEKTYSLVFIYLIRATRDRRLTDELILDVFQDIWCEAPIFDGEHGPVLGWIMGKARSHALAHAQSAGELQRTSDRTYIGLPGDSMPTTAASPPTPEDLQAAIDALTPDERTAIEAAFSGLSYAEVAANQAQSVGTIKKRVRSGLAKLRQSLRERGTAP
jgi:RNA polymerase sigma-70 factor (ECF subfamily)